MNKTLYIWKNGELIPWDNASTHVLTHALHYASAVFEGMRAYKTTNGPAIFRNQDHFLRLKKGASTYHIDIPYSTKMLCHAAKTLLKKNKLQSGYIRPIVYTGYGDMGIIPKNNPFDVVIAAWEWDSYFGEEALINGIRCTISPFQKLSSKALPATVKCAANYANSFLAKKDALTKGFNDAILLNQSGTIAEGPAANIFSVKNKCILTPPIEADLLEGITRDSIIQIIKAKGFKFSQNLLSVDDLKSADELFFTGTATEITPICEIDGHTIGNGKRGDITKEIQNTYFDIVKGKNQLFSHWLDYID